MELASVLTDVDLTGRRFLDAFWTANERPKSVEKAKVSSVPVDLRERFFRRCPLDAFGDHDHDDDN